MLLLTIKNHKKVLFTLKGRGFCELILQLAEVSVDYAFYRDVKRSISEKIKRNFDTSRVVKNMIKKK
ncbi:MAG: hypothetical protein AB9883_03195 [Acidaminococcaceae bacterium]